MARTITSDERDLLASDHANFYLRVEVKDGADAWRDLTDEGDVNYVESVTFGETIDAPTATGSVTLTREQGGLSLSPLITDSPLNLSAGDYAPLLDLGRAIRISTAVTLPDVAPVSGDWKEMFLGQITDADWASSPMTLTIADQGSYLLDAQIETVRTYGAAGGVPVEAEMQRILDDNMGAGTVTLYTPVSPTWNILPYDQATGGLLDALRALALQIGWDVRYRYDSSGVSRLTFFSVDRAKTVPDFTIGPSEYLNVQKLAISDADIINVAKVNYQNKTSLVIGSAIASDAGSIAEFGRRYMEIGEGSSSNIDTAEEAQRMADAAVADLAQPPADQAIEQFYFWLVQLGDLAGYLANGVHYNEDQAFGVISYQHTLSINTHRTTIAVRGKIAGAYRQWLLTRNGQFSGQITTGPAPLIFPPQGELQAFEDPARDGMIWQQVRFDKLTKFIDLYAFESATSPTPIPALSSIDSSYHLQRQDGDQWNGDDVDFIVGVATRANYYRKVIGIGIGPDGDRGPMIVQEVQAVDVGAGPTAPPSALAFVPAEASNRLTWTVGDADAYHIVFRNGIGKVLQPGVSAFLDSNIQVDIAHTYEICAWKNGQTSAKLSFGTAGPTAGGSGAPTWQAGYPLPIDENGVDFRWDCDPATTEIAIEVSPFTIVGLFYPIQVFTDGGHIPSGAVTDTSQARGTRMQVRLRALVAGVYKYSVPIYVTWGASKNALPTFEDGTPWRTVSETTFSWASNAPFLLINPAVTMQVWAQVVAGGPMTMLYEETDLALARNGTFVYTAGDLAGLNAQLIATYLVGGSAYGRVVRINGSL